MIPGELYATLPIEFKIGWNSLSGHQQHLIARQEFPRNNTSDTFSVNRRHATSHIGMPVDINRRLESTRKVSMEYINNRAWYIIMRPSDLLGHHIHMQNCFSASSRPILNRGSIYMVLQSLQRNKR